MAISPEKTILVVEDNERNMKLAVDLLEWSGFRVLKAFDAETALEILKTQQPDLIILDIGLPGIRGDKFYSMIRENRDFDHIKVVAFTASIMKHEKEELLQAGFNAFIEKPINTAVFVKEIKALLSLP